MKKAVKLIALLLSIALITLFCGCYAAYEKTYLKINTVNGGGTRKIQSFFISDGFVHPDSPAGGTHNNDTYFPKGINEAIIWLQSLVDDEIFTVALEDTDDGFHIVSVEFSFDSLEDYNNKLALLNSYGGSYSEEIAPASMTVAAEGNSYIAVWQEQVGVAHKATAWMYQALINEGSHEGVFNGDGVNYSADATRADGNAQDTMVLSGDTVYSVSLGDTTSVFNVQEKAFATGKFINDGSYKGTLAEALPENITSSSSSNQVTSSDNTADGKTVFWAVFISLLLLLMLVGFGAFYIGIRCRRMR